MIQSLTNETMSVTDKDTGKLLFTVAVSSGNNQIGDIGKANVGPIPPGSYSIYERPGGMGGARAWILDRNDSVKGNDTIDDGSAKEGKGRFGLRYHQEFNDLPNKGSEGCNVSDGKSIERFGKAADKTSKGPTQHVTSPRDHPGDGKPRDDFGKPQRIGIWKVAK